MGGLFLGRLRGNGQDSHGSSSGTEQEREDCGSKILGGGQVEGGHFLVITGSDLMNGGKKF